MDLSNLSKLQSPVQTQCTVTMQDCKKVLQTRVVGIVQEWKGVVGNDNTRHFFSGFLPEITDEEVNEATALLISKFSDLYEMYFNASMPSSQEENIVASRRTARKRRAPANDKDVTPTSENQSRRAKLNNLALF